MDKLSELLKRFSVTATVFHAGPLCGQFGVDDDDTGHGHLHLLRRGRLRFVDADGHGRTIEAPSLLLFPRPAAHRLEPIGPDAAEIVCATLRYGAGSRNAFADVLPAMLLVPLTPLERVRATIDWLFEEWHASHCGRRALLDRLTEVLLVQVLRYALDAQLVTRASLAAIAHPRLSPALQAIQNDPAHPWQLDELASLCAMSRSTFAGQFRQIVGLPPGEYLIDRRIGLAQKLLRSGKPVGQVANVVGYESASALARVFRRKTGCSPRDWLIHDDIRASA